MIWRVVMKKVLGILLIFSCLSASLGMRQSVQASTSFTYMVSSAVTKVDPRVRATLSGLQVNDKLTVIVTLRQRADLRRVAGGNRARRLQWVIRALQATADTTQGRLTSLLIKRRDQGLVSSFVRFWVFNGFSVTATGEVIDELAKHPDVLSISPDDIQIVPAAYGTPEPNISLINAASLWNLGITGQGVVVANMDSGVDVSHADLAARWRGGSDSWFDPYGQHPTTPTDLSGHGTGTMGIMVGGDAGGTSIGVAPRAQWVAVKIFNDSGKSTTTAIHQGFQWLLDPDGDPNTADAPQVVNNSWTYANAGCYLEFEPDLQALRAAGILPVFAAGNGGPYTNSSYSPANNPSAFAVGATNNNDQIYAYSSRGPTTCGGSTGPFPEMVAPGVNIRTTGLYGAYITNSGTSFAAPHVAGGLALLLSAYPGLTAAEQESALINSALDLGTVGADNVYGYGRLDLLAAYNWLATIPTATPALTDAPAPTATPTLSPTDTAMPAPSDTPPPADTATPTAAPTATPTNIPTVLPTDTPPPADTATPTLPPALSPTNTPAPLPTNTPTSMPAAATHIGDLDGSASGSRLRWNATATILVHDANENPVANATVSGFWSNGTTGTAACITNASGICQIAKSGLGSRTTSVRFTVSNVSGSALTYNAAANHDPDGDSDGSSLTIAKP
jgi:serine protease AprX